MLYRDLPQSVRITDFYKAGVTTHWHPRMLAAPTVYLQSVTVLKATLVPRSLQQLSGRLFRLFVSIGKSGLVVTVGDAALAFIPLLAFNMSSSADTMSEVKGLSDLELREKLTGLGMDVGPITGTTRTLYERKLVLLLTGNLPEPGRDLPQTPPKSPPKSPRKLSPRKTVIDQGHYDNVPGRDIADGYTTGEFNTSSRASLEGSTINLIRARKPVSRAVNEEPSSRKSIPRQSSPFPAANAQFRKVEPGSGGSTMDHVLKFSLFGIVMLVIIYLITNQEPGKSLEHRS